MQAQEPQLRVLHIMSGFGGGISSFILNKLESMPDQASGISQYVATYDQVSDRFQAAVEAAGGQVFPLVNPKVEGWRAFESSFKACFQAGTYDVVHCHVNGYRTLPYYLLAKRYGVERFYSHAHLERPLAKTWRQKAQEKLNQTAMRTLSDAYVGCGLDAIYSSYGLTDGPEKIVEIPNSINPQNFIISQDQATQKRLEGRRALGLGPSDYVIGQIARLAPIKNHWQTLKIAEEIQRQELPYVILLAGQGPLESTLQEEIKKRGLEDIVRLLGRVEPIEDFFPILDVLLLPSHSEGFPTVVVEAQASGVPTVMSASITEEVDCGLGLVQALDLEEPVSLWLSQITRSMNHLIPSADQRQVALAQRALTNRESAQVYQAFLQGDIDHFIMAEGWSME